MLVQSLPLKNDDLCNFDKHDFGNYVTGCFFACKIGVIPLMIIIMVDIYIGTEYVVKG